MRAALMNLELRRLLDRVEQARGPDRDLDVALAAALLGPHGAPAEAEVAPYTRSMDVTLELMQQAFPRWTVEASKYGHPGGARAVVWPEGLRAERCHDASGATLPLAILAALLKAKILEAQKATERTAVHALRPPKPRGDLRLAWVSPRA